MSTCQPSSNSARRIRIPLLTPTTFFRSIIHSAAVKPVNAIKEVFMPALSSTMTEGKVSFYA